jgi:hypothetical protein
MARQKTMFDRAAREELRRRMESIQPERPPLWGKMNSGQMLAHVNASLAMATGELPTKPKNTPMANPLVRWLVIYVMPWPKGTPTAPELLATPPGEWAADLVEFRDLLERAGTRSPDGDWPRHPAFGQMKGKHWGVLVYKHLDHHLRQFAV